MSMPGQLPQGGDQMPPDQDQGGQEPQGMGQTLNPRMIENALRIIQRSGKGKMPEHPANFAVEFMDTMNSLFEKKYHRQPLPPEKQAIAGAENQLLKKYYNTGPIDWDSGEGTPLLNPQNSMNQNDRSQGTEQPVVFRDRYDTVGGPGMSGRGQY